MDFRFLLLSFNGRIGRKQFWIWNISYYLFLSMVGSALAQISSTAALYAIPVMSLLLLYPDLAVTAKRWHDRNKSNRLLLLNIPLIIGRLLVPFSAQAETGEGMSRVLSLIALVCGLWILVECGFLKGSDTKNDYGEPFKN
ncbi:hypothetical protein A9264_11470 [Vibrio sp. UCD-FRSSP16_10]|uniref:DUF805 domain-containing protein n=1 Tax=unclassified Vibrio TaxID=2614977 RepID=UPI0007FB8D29|nr:MULTISPECIES: DUF805 domain-containing protein [unclassified Vibrio]OBT16424.1 hypothetical protein A9260_11680 [Vibrio sp. UCD-FRSSP16_30]OBT21289.1 hypothetical protein A9264_11470 [Vibrio sp. UCD-FRSSP16_10]